MYIYIYIYIYICIYIYIHTVHTYIHIYIREIKEPRDIVLSRKMKMRKETAILLKNTGHTFKKNCREKIKVKNIRTRTSY